MNDNINVNDVIFDLESESISIEELESRLLGLMKELDEFKKYDTNAEETKLRSAKEDKLQDAKIPAEQSKYAVSEGVFKELDGEKAVADENFAFKLNDFAEGESVCDSSDEIGLRESQTEYIGDKELLMAAARLVVEEGVTSVSFLQRSLGIGYGRASEIVIRLEELAIISPMDGNKPRRVMVSPEKLEKILSTL